ncbi:MAG: hypothetical protein K2K56_06040 [Lachnospiraceae bacterium]|nr:hypothetical protein [Lachnospiraceae bacterium]
MSVGINDVSNYTSAYAATGTASGAVNQTAEAKNQEAVNDKKDEAAVYEKSSQSTEKATYSVTKMSKADRAALVQQLKADADSRAQNLTNMVSKMLGQQTNSYGKANGIWRFIASGNYTVDAQTKAQAQKDIAEDGYYGVKQTSQRLFDFASALAGDDVEKMKKMQAAVEKGYKLAEKAWGGSLPGISQETLAATNKLFEDYYKSKGSAAD